MTATLTAADTGNGRFVNWSGDVPGGESTENPLTLTLNGNANVTANYSRSPFGPGVCGAAATELGATLMILTVMMFFPKVRRVASRFQPQA